MLVNSLALDTAKSAAGGGLGPAATSITSVGSAGGMEMAGEGAATAAALRSLDALKPMGRLHRVLEDSSHYLKTSSSTYFLNSLLGAPLLINKFIIIRQYYHNNMITCNR